MVSPVISTDPNCTPMEWKQRQRPTNKSILICAMSTRWVASNSNNNNIPVCKIKIKLMRLKIENSNGKRVFFKYHNSMQMVKRHPQGENERNWETDLETCNKTHAKSHGYFVCVCFINVRIHLSIPFWEKELNGHGSEKEITDQKPT